MVILYSCPRKGIEAEGEIEKAHKPLERQINGKESKRSRGAPHGGACIVFTSFLVARAGREHQILLEQRSTWICQQGPSKSARRWVSNARADNPATPQPDLRKYQSLGAGGAATPQCLWVCDWWLASPWPCVWLGETVL